MNFDDFESRLNAALRRFLDTNLMGVLFTDLAGKIVDADDSFLSMVGYAREELPQSLSKLTAPEHHRLDEEAFEKLMAFGACAPFEKDLVRRDGFLARRYMTKRLLSLLSTFRRTSRRRKNSTISPITTRSLTYQTRSCSKIVSNRQSPTPVAAIRCTRSSYSISTASKRSTIHSVTQPAIDCCSRSRNG
jgi:PAS domain S-box-containing protein